MFVDEEQERIFFINAFVTDFILNHFLTFRLKPTA